MSGNFWNQKNVFITGINGFVGGNLAKALLDAGANVFGLVKTIDQRSYLYYTSLNKKVVLINGNITNKTLLNTFFSENDIHICYHLASQVEVGVAIKYPFSTWETNIRGTYTLFEAIRESAENVSAIVVASSDKAYGEYPQDKLPYQEHYPLNPRYTYDTSKACADLIARSYSSELFNMPVIITRFSNIYGPGQLNFSAIIPDAIQCALGYDEFVPRSDGKNIRDFLFVEDVANLYVTIAESLYNNNNLKGEVFNAGTNDGKTVRYVIEKIYTQLNNEKALKKILDLFDKNSNPMGEINNQVMHYKKVKKYFGWEPLTEFDYGLDVTIEWFAKYIKNIGSK